VQATEWGESSAKGDSLLDDLQLWNSCNQGGKFKRDSRRGKRGKREMRKSQQKGRKEGKKKEN